MTIQSEFLEALQKIADEKSGKAQPTTSAQPEPNEPIPGCDIRAIVRDEVRAAVRELIGASHG